jgi:hypothetical protein
MDNKLVSQNAFVDEYGNPNLNTYLDGVSELFILVAVLISPAALEKTRETIQDIQKLHFHGRLMKSSTVGNNDVKRIAILNKMAEIDFSYYALIAIKENIWKESGLNYKQPFFKFFHKGLYNRIALLNSNITVLVHAFGKSDFKDGFRKYVDNTVKPTFTLE